MHFHQIIHHFFVLFLMIIKTSKKCNGYKNLITHLLNKKKERFIQESLQFLNANTQFSDQTKWKYIKFEIRNFVKQVFQKYSLKISNRNKKSLEKI